MLQCNNTEGCIEDRRHRDHACASRRRERLRGRASRVTRAGRRLVAVALTLLVLAAAPMNSARAASPDAIAVAPGIHVFPGTAGETGPSNLGRIANVGVVVGTRGVVVIDSGVSFRHGEAIIAAVRRLTHRPIRLAILTHPSQEVVFGAAAFQAHGIPVLMHREAAALMAARCDQCLQRLTQMLGRSAMEGTRIVTPDRLVDATTSLDAIGRTLVVIAPRDASAPGALAVLDPLTRTLFAGSMVSVDYIPDMRDSDGRDWRNGLAVLASTHCIHLVPSYGTIGDCTAIASVDRYFEGLDACVRRLFAKGVGLAEVPTRCDLPEFAAWDGYATLHRANASRAFLRIERASFDR
jgi:glyoxylase-like metal-dependent hydrolase (beta-lactamase superfamily II)